MVTRYLYFPILFSVLYYLCTTKYSKRSHKGSCHCGVSNCCCQISVPLCFIAKNVGFANITQPKAGVFSLRSGGFAYSTCRLDRVSIVIAKSVLVCSHDLGSCHGNSLSGDYRCSFLVAWKSVTSAPLHQQPIRGHCASASKFV